MTDPGNYRGVHLTTVLSKVVERVLNTLLAPYLKAADAFGQSQFGFQRGLSCSDLVATLVNSWILALNRRQKVGVYLSDISGAFDKVKTKRLLAKLRAAGLNDTFLAFFDDYLASRAALVLVGGESSAELELKNTVFQGTVLGPSLWNTFFKDVRTAAESTGGRESKFADDLSVTKEYNKSTKNEEVLADLQRCQQNVHQWGEANRVEFDPTKEEFAVVHHREGEGPDFRLLGPVFDSKLLMHKAVQKVLGKARPKLQALLQTQRFYSTGAMVEQFETHLLCTLESCNAAIYHAADSVLEPLGHVQETFLRKVGLTKEEAFLEYNLGTLSWRRDAAMLGLLHKCTLGQAHPRLRELFPSVTRQPAVYSTRYAERRHSKQLLERCTGDFLELTRRSLFGLVRVYNFLPELVVQTDTVKEFQALLTATAKEHCRQGRAWESMYSPRCTRQG